MLAGIRATGVTIVLVEQNARAALAIADRGIVLVEGRERHSGTALALATDPEVARLYLGGKVAGTGAGGMSAQFLVDGVLPACSSGLVPSA